MIDLTEKYIAYIIQNLSGKITKTQLVKLLYLIDVESVKYVGQPLTDIRWKFHHYGPYDEKLDGRLKNLKSHGIISVETKSKKNNPDETYFLYTYTGNKNNQEDFVASQKQIVDTILKQFGSFTLNSLLNYVYETKPMKIAKKGEYINLNKMLTSEKMVK